MSIFEPDQNLGEVKPSEADWCIRNDNPSPEKERLGLNGLRLLAVSLILISLAFVNRLAFLQITKGADNSLLAEGNRVRGQIIHAPRGLITDRFGTVLAKNIAAFAVEIMPIDLPRSKEERLEIYALMAQKFNLSTDDLIAEIEKNGLRSPNPIIIAQNISHEEAIDIKVDLKDIPGTRVIERPIREYLQSPGLAHLLGYTGKINQAELESSERYDLQSIVGKIGIEKSYEEKLYGQSGLERIEVNSLGYYQRTLSKRDPIPGENVVLSINFNLQQKLATELQKTLEEKESPSGTAIIINPQNGQIKAMVSLPDYDNNEFAGGIDAQKYQELLQDENKPLINRAISGVYPSGSVIKPFIATGALEEEVITENTKIDAPASISIGQFTFPDWKIHGIVDVKKSLAVSSNIFFYAIGGGWKDISGLGVDKIGKYLKLFGFGQSTDIDLNGELTGLVPDEEWKQRVRGEPWYIGDTYHLSIGQGGFLVTPIQIAKANATIANGGHPYKPQLILKTTQKNDADIKETPYNQQQPEKILDSNSIEIVRQGMREAVEYGSARRLQELPVTSAGKTGTAQFGTEDKTHAWFTAFAPYENPEVAITVLVEAGGGGHETALPVALETLKWYFAQDENKR